MAESGIPIQIPVKLYSGALSLGDSNTLVITFPNEGHFLIVAKNRRTSGKPFACVVQKYQATTNYQVLSNGQETMSTSNISSGTGGIKVTMPDTYYDVSVIGSCSFTLSTS